MIHKETLETKKVVYRGRVDIIFAQFLLPFCLAILTRQPGPKRVFIVLAASLFFMFLMAVWDFVKASRELDRYEPTLDIELIRRVIDEYDSDRARHDS